MYNKELIYSGWRNLDVGHYPMIIISCGILLFSNLCYSTPDCISLAKQVVMKSPDLLKEVIATSGDDNSAEPICKPTPWDAKKTILAIGDQVFLVNSSDGYIYSHGKNMDLLQAGENPYEVAIDTAPYILAKNTRAFGIRSYLGSGGNGGGSEATTIVLYVIKDESIHSVMGPLVVDSREFFISKIREEGKLEEIDESKSFDCDQSSTLVMSNNVHQGFKDIILHNSYTQNRCSKKFAKDWDETYVFNGAEYVPLNTKESFIYQNYQNECGKPCP